MGKEKVLQNFRKVFGDRFVPYPESIREVSNGFLFMAKGNEEKFLTLVEKSPIGGFEAEMIGKMEVDSTVRRVKTARLTHRNLIRLRELFGYLSPSRAGLKKSFGTGDRLGIVTPAHIQAFLGEHIFPVLAQQSVRENERTERDFQMVLDDATWGCFEAGYRGPFGADADHVKRIEDLKEAADCGYTMYTIDPSDFVKDGILALSEEDQENLLLFLGNLRTPVDPNEELLEGR